MTNPAHLAESLGQSLAQARREIAAIIFGQDRVIDLTLITLLAGGHALFVGLPGLAKTTLAQTLGTVLGLDERRIQCTPDLMPADILGSEVLESGADGSRAFRFLEGPVFAQLLMADEINRASPRTQSALLQAMQEAKIAVAGTYRDLPRPFHVLATQNPLEHEGTYPLPEAQLDRFLMRIDVDYPDRAAERAMLIATTGTEPVTARPVLDAATLIRAQSLVRGMPVGERLVDAILDLVRLARPNDHGHDLARQWVAWGPGPRAAQSLMLAIRARALLDGRFAPSLADLAALAGPVLAHRMNLTHAARAEGMTCAGLIERLVQAMA